MASRKKSPSMADKPSLFIDTTAMNEIMVAIVKGAAVKQIHQPIGFEERDDLLRYIDRLVKLSRTPLDQIGSIIVIRGPGPFTAIRVGVTVANALGLAFSVPVYGANKVDSTDIARIVSKVKLTAPDKVPVRPLYDRAPNITKPKIRKQ